VILIEYVKVFDPYKNFRKVRCVKMRKIETLRIGLFIIAGLLLAPGFVFGDVLELKNGTILNGKYVGGTIRFETNDGTKTIETSQAVALTFTTPAPSIGTVAVPVAPAAPQAAGAVQQQAKVVTIPAGTTLPVRMRESISSMNPIRTIFGTTLEADIVVDGLTALKAGTKILGELHDVNPSGQIALGISLTKIRIDKGMELITTSNYKAGSTVGTSILKKGDIVTIPPGTLLEFQLTKPLTLNVH
jgi:hypothetical protein